MGKFRVKTRETIFGKIFEKIGKKFKKRPQIINLNEAPMETRCIMIGNHCGARGPINYRAFIEKRFMIWGAHQMCEGFHSRRKYLYHIFYQQKLGYSKLRSFFLSIGFGIVSKFVYNYAGMIPVYYDARTFSTFKYSIQCLEKDVSVLIFPEDSNDGYKFKIDKLWPGFLHLAKLCYKRYGKDIPVYTLYYDKGLNTITIGKPMYFSELAKVHSEEEMVKIFMDYMNSFCETDSAALANETQT